MHLTERLNNDQFFILIGVFTSLIVVSYCIRNRPTLLKSLFLANLKKTHFKFVSNNIQDQIVELLFWNSLLLQSLFFISYLNIYFTTSLIVFEALLPFILTIYIPACNSDKLTLVD